MTPKTQSHVMQATAEAGRQEGEKQTRHFRFWDGFKSGILRALATTLILFVVFLTKVPGIIVGLLLSPLVEAPHDLRLGAALVYLLITCGLNTIWTILTRWQNGDLHLRNIIGYALGTLAVGLPVSPFAFQLALFAFLFGMPPISLAVGFS